MFQGLEHTAISSPDPKKLAEWYEQHLEFKINFTYNGNYFVRAANGSLIEIIPADTPLPKPQVVADNKVGGIRHLAIASDDFDQAYAHLQSLNVTFVCEPFETLGNRLVFFNDLDGNLLHLIQRQNPLP